MALNTFEVDQSLIVHCRVKVIVAGHDMTAAQAIEAAAELMPNNFDAGSREGWKAKVDVTPPKGTMLLTGKVRGTYIEAASGGEKARKVGAKEPAE